MNDGGGGDNWSYKSCKAPVKSSPPTNQHPAFYRPDALPVAQPTVSERSRGHNLQLPGYCRALHERSFVIHSLFEFGELYCQFLCYVIVLMRVCRTFIKRRLLALLT